MKSHPHSFDSLPSPVQILCGRAYDPALFAAEPVRRGFPAAMALHAAKILECGAIATTPGSGSETCSQEIPGFWMFSAISQLCYIQQE